MKRRLHKRAAVSRSSQSAQKSKMGLRRIFAAFGYSFSGLRAAWRHEAAFRQEILLGLLLSPVVIWAWIYRGRWQGLLLAGSILLVLIIELINSGIEALADSVSLERRETLGRAKDIGSAAVLLSLVLAGIVWLCVLWP